MLELQGISCLALDEVPAAKQQIVCSRSFKNPLVASDDLLAALSEFCSRAAEKLRSQQCVAGALTVFIETNPFRPREPQYQRSATRLLPHATQDTRRLVGQVRKLLQEIYRDGYRYHKCGVLPGHVQPEAVPGQLDLFAGGGVGRCTEEGSLMRTVDSINQRFPAALAVASTGLGRHWQYQSARLSGHYTTQWRELAKVRCQ